MTIWGAGWRVGAVAAALAVQILFILSLDGKRTAPPEGEAPVPAVDAVKAPAFSGNGERRGKTAGAGDRTARRDSQGNAPPAGLGLSKELFTDDLDGILRRRHLRVLTTFNRTNFFLAEGRQQGFEYSLLRDFETHLNRERKKKGLKIHVEFIPVYRDELIPKLLAGEGDVSAAGLTVTPARAKQVDFTDPYLKGVDEVVVTRKGGWVPGSLDELAGREVHLRRSSSYHESVLALNERFRDRGLPPVKIAVVDEILETEDILELVSAGAVEITVADSHLARIWSGVHGNLEVHDGLKVREGGEIAWMVRKGSPRLKGSLNEFIATRRKGTKYGNIYFNRFYRDNPWVRKPLGEEERKKIDQYRKLFEKYSEMYGLPWLLTAAVAYQESGFDHSKRSGAGAVGVMQVLPSTARDKSIGIDDVTVLENNVHAGVKYLAHLRDHYFDEEGLDPASRLHFVLAAYNAGPGNLRKARGTAPSWSVDPDRWFKNVEVVVLRTVSQEPVQYVININRYQLLFDHYVRTREQRETLRRDLGKR